MTDPFLSDETNPELEKISADPNKTLDDFFDAEEAKALKHSRPGSTSDVSGSSDETKEE